ncbi:MAG: hypothetical protein WAW42_11760 [Candidatus Competibacteraceae bacterium]|jgi:hypothetical protein
MKNRKLRKLASENDWYFKLGLLFVDSFMTKVWSVRLLYRITGFSTSLDESPPAMPISPVQTARLQTRTEFLHPALL